MALLLLVERQTGANIRQDFERLVNEGMSAVSRNTMENIRNRIREGIVSRT